MEKLGIDYEKKWAEFEAEVKQIEDGKKAFMTWEDAK